MKITGKSYFGVPVYDGRFINQDDIKKLPFYDFWLESALGSAGFGAPDDPEVFYTYLHDWQAFCELFINTGQHRFIKQKERIQKKKIAWLTDLHLDHLYGAELQSFFKLLGQQRVDAFFVTGDISTSSYIEEHLLLFEQLRKPIYFVLGNHDFYGSSVLKVREKIKSLESDYLHYLSQNKAHEIQPDVFVVGHEGWADGKDLEKSGIRINDFHRIEDLFLELGEDTADRRKATLKRLANLAVEHINSCLIQLPPNAKDIFILTHPPPFREICIYKDQLEEMKFLPHYLNQILGNYIIEFAKQNPAKNITVLCGHTHKSARAKILPNLTAQVGFAQYGSPAIIEYFEV